VSLTSLTILRRPRRRRGFNLVEMLIALAITAALLSATMVALDASFMAYQTTTEVASTHTISRLAMLRLMTLIVESSEIEFLTPGDDVTPSQLIRIEWFETPDGAHPAPNALYVVVDGGTPQLLLEGVIPAFDEFDDNMSVELDGDNQQQIRLVASAMPRIEAYQFD
jgi:prepilin-type N-terminal cleavage/methylation domain-containing protein